MEDSLRESWSNGSYDEMAPNYLSLAGHLVERTAVDEDDEVLDIGCGTGSVALTAARRGADVTGVDVTPSMLEHARTNADRIGVDGVQFDAGDAAALPFEEDTFDVTLSSLGHMYGDPPSVVTAELLRVTRPGGHIGFTAWMPTGLYPFMAGVMATYVPPDELPDFTEPPFMWGDSNVVRGRLGEAVESLAFETETAHYPALSPETFWEEISTKSGMFARFLDTIDESERQQLRDEMVSTIEPYFDDRKNAVELEYLLTTATR